MKKKEGKINRVKMREGEEKVKTCLELWKGS